MGNKRLIGNLEISNSDSSQAAVYTPNGIELSEGYTLSYPNKEGTLATLNDIPDLHVATSSAIGGVKSGGDITVASTGEVTVNNATTADKLTTARKIGLTGAAIASGVSFDGSSDININVNNVNESYLTWGGKNFAGCWGPIDAAMVPQFAANRFAFLPASAITSEYSTDGGTTWLTITESNARENLFATTGSFFIGNNNATGLDKSNYKCRITITTSGVVYSTLNKFAIRVSTNGSTGSHVTLESRTKANQDAGNNTWETNVARAELLGWSGWNIINISGITTHGNTSAQYSQLRFTFGVDSHPSTSKYNGLQILSIMAFGGEGWTTPSTMASNGHLYSYDAGKNATFPAKVTATQFIGSLDGNAKTASSLNNSVAIQFNAGTTEGTDKFTFNGSANKVVNITPAAIGAALSSHTHGNITNTGELGTASRIVVTDVNKKVTTGSIDPATIVLNTDTRLTNARTPLAHTHVVADINDFPEALPADGGNADTVDGKHASDFVSTSQKGAALGVAELGADGKVPSYQLPSYVDDVIEYSAKSSFPATGESGKIYIETSTSKTWRWSGTQYVEISSSIALGETSSTAYRGDRGKVAYDHSQTAHAPSDAEKNVQSDWNITDTSSDAYIKNKPTIPIDTNTTYGLSAPADKTNGNVTIDLTAGGSGSGTDSVHIVGEGDVVVTTDKSGVITVCAYNDSVYQEFDETSNKDLHLLFSYMGLDGSSVDSAKKSSRMTFNPSSGKFLVGLPNVYYEDDYDGDGIIDNSYYDNNNAGTGTLEVIGDIIAGGGSDDYGIVPARDNYSTIGRADLKWYQIYGTNIYGTNIHEGGTPLSNKYATKSHASTATTYGASSATNYGHAKASSTAPKAPAETASVGSETSSFARGDHVHQAQAVVTIYTWEADD